MLGPASLSLMQWQDWTGVNPSSYMTGDGQVSYLTTSPGWKGNLRHLPVWRAGLGLIALVCGPT